MPRPLIPDQLRHVPFTGAQAAAAGLSKRSLDSKPWRQVIRGVWVHTDVPDTRELRLHAVTLVLPPYAVICGLTAAWIYGLDVRHEQDIDVHVGFPKGKRIRKRPGVVVCQETLAAEDWQEIGGVRVTTPLRTTFDCLRWLRGAERLVVADAMTHAELVTLDELATYFASKYRLRNLRRGEAMLEYVEPLTESPMETRLRVVLLDGGMRLIPQHNIYDAAGVFVARADLALPEVKLAVEYDGAWHWKQRREDDRRRAAMRAAGWEVLVYSADYVYGNPLGVAAEVRQAIYARRYLAG